MSYPGLSPPIGRRELLERSHIGPASGFGFRAWNEGFGGLWAFWGLGGGEEGVWGGGGGGGLGGQGGGVGLRLLLEFRRWLRGSEGLKLFHFRTFRARKVCGGWEASGF